MNSKKLSAILTTTLIILSILPITAQAYVFDTASSVQYAQNLDPAGGANLIVTALDATDVLLIVWSAGLCNPVRSAKFKFTKNEIKEGVEDTIDGPPALLGFNPGESFAVLIAGVYIFPDFFPDPTFDIAVFANSQDRLGGARWAAIDVQQGFQVLNNGADIRLILPDDATFHAIVDDDGDFSPGESRDYFTAPISVLKQFCNNEEQCLESPEQHACQDYNVRRVTTADIDPAPFPPFVVGSPFEPPFVGHLIGLVREQVDGDDPATVGYQTIERQNDGEQILAASYADHFGSVVQELPLSVLESIGSLQTPQGLLIPDDPFLPNPDAMAIGVTRAGTPQITTNFLSIVNHADFEVEVVVEGYNTQCTKFDRTYALTSLDTVLIDLNEQLGTYDPLLLVVKAVDIDGNLDTTAQISSKVFYEQFNYVTDQQYLPTAEYRLHNVEAFQTADRIEFVGPKSMYTPFHDTDLSATGQILVIGNPVAVIGGPKTLNFILNQEDEETFSSTQTVGCVQEIDPTTLAGAEGLFGVSVFGDKEELVIGAAFEQLTQEFTVSAEQAVGTDRTTAAIPIQVRPPESTNFQVFVTPFIDPILDPSWDMTVYGVQTNPDGSEIKDTGNVVCPTTIVTPGTGEAEAFAANLACKVSPTSTKTILVICNDDMDPDCFELGIHPS